MADVLIDASVWIEFFRKREPWYGITIRLMEDSKVCCLGLILAELIQGAKSKKEISVLNNFLQVFPFLPETPELWANAGRLSFSLRRKGATIGLADCFIATAAVSAGVQVATLDNHFKTISELAKLSLFSPPGE